MLVLLMPCLNSCRPPSIESEHTEGHLTVVKEMLEHKTHLIALSFKAEIFWQQIDRQINRLTDR